MVERKLGLPENYSCFLFGARGTGKTTLLQTRFGAKDTLFINLLDPLEEDRFLRNPAELEQRCLALDSSVTRVIIDEIQKVPRLLDVVHKLIESRQLTFIMTGSSARKLKRGASNLLAGRAFIFHLHPFVHTELGGQFRLEEVLRFGSLPQVFQFDNESDKARYLRAYALTYLKEEIFAEQIIRKLEPFRLFLEVAAQSNGKIINYTKIGDDIGVDTKTVQSYFTILADTLTGYLLPAWHGSLRKRQRMNPKFYFFDPGVARALAGTVHIPLQPGTYAYGEAFEHLVILELMRLADYAEKDWRFSYLQTKDGAEIDLIVERPGLPTVLVEIKSSDTITDRDTAPLRRFVKDFPDAVAFCLSRDPHARLHDGIRCFSWMEGIARILE